MGKRGRPQHIPTEESRQRVCKLVAFGKPDAIIAGLLDISVGTLKKYYKTELKYGLHVLEDDLGGVLVTKAQNGCFKSLDKILNQKMGWDKPAIGEKEQPKRIIAEVIPKGQDINPYEDE